MSFQVNSNNGAQNLELAFQSIKSSVPFTEKINKEQARVIADKNINLFMQQFDNDYERAIEAAKSLEIKASIKESREDKNLYKVAGQMKLLLEARKLEAQSVKNLNTDIFIPKTPTEKAPVNGVKLSELMEANLNVFSIIYETDPSAILWCMAPLPSLEELKADLKLLKNGDLSPDQLKELRAKHSHHLENLTSISLQGSAQAKLYPYCLLALYESSRRDGKLAIDPKGNNMFHYAAILNDSDSIKKGAQLLKSLGQDLSGLNSSSKKGFTPLYAAIRQKNYDAIKSLLENGADVNCKSLGLSMLHVAVSSQDLQSIKLLLAHKEIDMTALNSEKQSVAHLVALINTPEEILEQLKKHPEFEKAGNKPDIYGFNVVDIKTKKIIDISQPILIEKLTKYLEVNGRNTQVIDQEGMCNGLAFLAQYYGSKGKQEGFFKALEVIAQWDGDKDSLKSEKEVKGLRERYNLDEYSDLADFFEQWTNDIVWFMHTYHLGGNSNLQSKREDQLEIIKGENNPLNVNFMERGTKSDNYTKELLQNKLEAYKDSPGTILEFGGAGHKTSARVLEDGKIFYYDPNCSSEISILDSMEELSELIIDTKYKMLGKQTEPTFELEFLAYKFF